MSTSKIESAIQSKSLTELTRALGKLGPEFIYRLAPPNTEITQYRAKEEGDEYAIHFTASLQLA